MEAAQQLAKPREDGKARMHLLKHQQSVPVPGHEEERSVVVRGSASDVMDVMSNVIYRMDVMSNITYRSRPSHPSIFMKPRHWHFDRRGGHWRFDQMALAFRGTLDENP